MDAKEKYKEICSEIDKLGDDWFKYKNCEKDDAAGFSKKTELWGKIYELLFQLPMYKYSEEYCEVIHDYLIDEIKLFDPQISKSFFKFLTVRLAYRKKTLYSKKTKMYNRIGVFLDENVEQDEKDINKYDLIANKNNDIKAVEDDIDNKYLALKIIAMSTRFDLKGRANNESRRKHFKNFYTDDISSLIVDTEDVNLYIDNEAEIFRALNLNFLDFFTVEKCRSIKEINKSHLKKYSDMVDGKEKELSEFKRPLPGDVYISYYEKIENEIISAGAISQQRSFYSDLFKKHLMDK